MTDYSTRKEVGQIWRKMPDSFFQKTTAYERQKIYDGVTNRLANYRLLDEGMLSGKKAEQVADKIIRHTTRTNENLTASILPDPGKTKEGFIRYDIGSSNTQLNNILRSHEEGMASGYIVKVEGQKSGPAIDVGARPEKVAQIANDIYARMKAGDIAGINETYGAALDGRKAFYFIDVVVITPERPNAPLQIILRPSNGA